MIPGRSKSSCKSTWRRTQKCMSRSSTCYWSSREDGILSELVKELDASNWSEIKRKLNQIGGIQKKTSRQCRDRWINHVNPKIKKYQKKS